MYVQAEGTAGTCLLSITVSITLEVRLSGVTELANFGQKTCETASRLRLWPGAFFSSIAL